VCFKAKSQSPASSFDVCGSSSRGRAPASFEVNLKDTLGGVVLQWRCKISGTATEMLQILTGQIPVVRPTHTVCCNCTSGFSELAVHKHPLHVQVVLSVCNADTHVFALLCNESCPLHPGPQILGGEEITGCAVLPSEQAVAQALILLYPQVGDV